MRVKISMVVLLLGMANAEANLIANGDFEQGNTGFTSSYQYNPLGSQQGAEGDYYVGDNSKAWNGNFPIAMYDHTTGSGLMLLANGSNNRSAVWQQTVSVAAGVEYAFSGWIASLYSQSLPLLDFLVDGQSIGSDLTSNVTWTKFTSSWVASQSGTATLSIRDLNTAWLGNDFALDDLSFEAIPEPAAASLFGVAAYGVIWMRKRYRDW